jgi:hypothetical protein
VSSFLDCGDTPVRRAPPSRRCCHKNESGRERDEDEDKREVSDGERKKIRKEYDT